MADRKITVEQIIRGDILILATGSREVQETHYLSDNYHVRIRTTCGKAYTYKGTDVVTIVEREVKVTPHFQAMMDRLLPEQ